MYISRPLVRESSSQTSAPVMIVSDHFSGHDYQKNTTAVWRSTTLFTPRLSKGLFISTKCSAFLSPACYQSHAFLLSLCKSREGSQAPFCLGDIAICQATVVERTLGTTKTYQSVFIAIHWRALGQDFQVTGGLAGKTSNPVSPRSIVWAVTFH